MSVDDPAILDSAQKAVEDDPILAVIDERIAAIEAAVPPDLTKITIGGPTLGLESLVSASMEGDPAPVESPIDGGGSDNIEAPGTPNAETVRISLNEVIDGQISADTIAIDVDKVTRAVALAVVPADLAQIGVGVGAAVTAINSQSSYGFLEGGLPVAEILQCDVALGKRTIRLQLIFRDESAEQVPSDDAPASEADGYWSEDWNRFAQAVPSADSDAPWRDRRPVFGSLTEMPLSDHQRERVRLPRPMAVDWPGWGREPDVYMDYRPPPRPVQKQRSPLYDRRR